jgi:hypothetical protein
MAAKKKQPLIPPDLERCQAEKPNGHSFMTLGGVPGLERCKNKPTMVITEKVAIDSRGKGSMSLCDGCHAQFVRQMPKGTVDVQDVDTFPAWRSIPCDLCAKPAQYEHPKGGRRCGTCPRPA